MHIMSTNLTKRWLGNTNVMSNCDVTNNTHQLQIATTGH